MSERTSDIASTNILPTSPKNPSIVTKPTATTTTVPIPTKYIVRTIKSSCSLTAVQGKAAEDLLPGDSIRIGYPHASYDYTISSDLSE